MLKSNRYLYCAAFAVLNISVSHHALGWNEAVAKFDVDQSELRNTFNGHTSVMDSGNSAAATPFAGTNANNVVLTISRIGHDDDRDRGTAGPLANHPYANMLRDMTHAQIKSVDTNVALRVDVSGLEPEHEYRVRVFNYDLDSNNKSESIWVDGTATSVDYKNAGYLKVHRNLNAKPNEGHFDLRMKTDANGAFALLARGGAPNQVVIFNGLEIYELPPKYTDVIKVDVNLTNSGQSGAQQSTAPGYLGLNPDGPYKNTGSVTNNNVSVTITSTSTNAPTRCRPQLPADNVFADFIFADHRIDIDIDGLTVDQEYELTILSQDTDANIGYKSAWYQAGNKDAFNSFHFNANNINTPEESWKFRTTFLAYQPSVSIYGTNAFDTTYMPFLNGVELRETGRSRVLAVEFGANGQRLQTDKGFQEFSRPDGKYSEPQSETFTSPAGVNNSVTVTLAPAGTTALIGYRDRGDGTHEMAKMLEDVVFADIKGTEIDIILGGLQRGDYEIVVYSHGIHYGVCAMNIIADGEVKDSAHAISADIAPKALRTLVARFSANGSTDEVIKLQTTDTAYDMRFNGFELYRSAVVPSAPATIFMLN
ncbi:MAG: hypothetical protein PHO37_14235 [Kiritimatiellae bacterium]|nr:hypothetical protein [Kiritimatiellia bacterium]